MGRQRSRVLAALLAFVALLAVAWPALAFTPPALDGHVVDTAGVLSREQILALDGKLEDVRQRTGFEIVAFVAGSLEGEPIEDVGYTLINTWHVGKKGADNGVILIVAPHERKTRIETGRGVEGALTDLQTNDILNEQVIPALKENRIYDAVDKGTSAIARTLAGDAAVARRPRGARPPPQAQPLSLIKLGFAAGGILLLVFLSIVSPGFRAFLWLFVELFLFRGGGGRGGGGGGDGGGSGYSGGGGSGGGGGSSEDY